jgi:hypothetical protein
MYSYFVAEITESQYLINKSLGESESIQINAEGDFPYGNTRVDRRNIQLFREQIELADQGCLLLLLLQPHFLHIPQWHPSKFSYKNGWNWIKYVSRRPCNYGTSQ